MKLHDRSTWGSGPWDDEGDREVWRDEATGLDCLIRRNYSGALCGYVAVPPGHPDYGGDLYHADLAVHGGITYAAECDGDTETGICHVADPGCADEVWWFGFDCAHAWDIIPAHVKLMEKIRSNLGHDLDVNAPTDPTKPFVETYKNWAFVKAEIAELAQQLAGRA